MQKNYLMRLMLILLCLGFSPQLFSQITGTVFKDFNGNGTFESAGPTFEVGVSGITVNAYNSSNSIVSTTTSGSDGSYTMPFTVPVRLEFVIPTNGACTNSTFDFTGFSTDGNNIRLVNASGTYNYGILNPDEYVVNSNPKVYVPMQVMGDPLGGGTTSSQTAVFGYEYNSSGVTSGTVTITQSQVGSLWGGTYSKQAKKYFTSAFIKRHCGLGPLGSGGIYMLDDNGSSLTATNFYDLDANGWRTRASSSAVAYGAASSYSVAGGTAVTYLGSTDPLSGFPEGLGVVGSNASDRLLPAAMNGDAYDPAAFDQVGKVGLGDLDISDNGKFLYVMNLYTRQLIRLELNNAYNPTSVIAVTAYSIPTVTVSNGVLRPFAVEYHRGKIYVGTVASGENGGSNADLFAYVFEMNDPEGSASFNATPVFSLPLNYQKGYPALFANNPAYKFWYPWSSNSANVSNFGEQVWGSPILSNLNFTDRGDMILNFMDRGGHQYGYNTYLHLDASAPFVNAMYDVSGDVLIAGKDCSTGGWTIENNGTYNSNGTNYTSGGVNNTEGPGNGEFFYLDVPPDHYHHETSQGASAIVPGTKNGIFTLMDANSAFAGGTARFDIFDGGANSRLNLYGGTDGFLSKANGLGDIEVAGDEPPIEIGNQVWLDSNNDGIQSGGESGIANVSIDLFCDFDNNGIPDGGSIASTTTDANGHWYFNSLNVTDGDCNTAGNQAGLQLNKTYLVSIGSADWASGNGAGDLLNKFLTLSNSTVVGIPDASDNDATLVSSLPTISVTTGSKWGQNNHSYDFGFTDTPPCTVTASVVAGNQNFCVSGDPAAFTVTTPASGNGTLTYSWESSTVDCNSGFNPISGADASTYDAPAGLTTTTYYHVVVTNTNGSFVCTATSNCITVTINPLPVADAGQDQNLNCTITSATIGTTAISGNTYSWSPSTGLSSATDAMPTATPSSTTTYTVTVTNTASSCTATDVVTVNVNTTSPTADAGQDQNLNCTTTSATIGTAAISGNTYSWSPNTALNDATLAMPTASPSTTTTYTVTVTGSNGCTATDVVTVNVNTTAPTADAGQDKNLDCVTTSTTIGTAAIAGNTYSWSPNTALNDATLAMPTASPSATTSYTVTVTGTNGCTATDVVTVNVASGVPVADAGLDKTVNCTTTSVTIGTAAIGGNTYSWSPSTGLSSATDAMPTATPSATTTYTVTVTNTTSNCTATDIVTVAVDVTTPTADAGQDKNHDCITTSSTIGTTAVSGNTYSWSPNTALNDATLAMPTASPSVTTNYTVTVTAANGCTATDVVTVNVNTTAPTADAGQDKNLDCVTTSTTIGTAAIAGNTYSWSPNTALNDATLAMPTASSSTTTTYTVTVTGTNGCTATDVVTVNVAAGVPVADAGLDKTIDCNTASVTIGSAAIGGNTYSWSPSTGLSSATDAMPTATPSATTTYTVTVTNTTSNCTATDIVTVTVDVTSPTADAGQDKNHDCITTSSTIGTTAVSGNTYSWSPNTALNDATLAMPTASPAVTTTYTVTVTGSNGCTATDVVTVNVNTTAPTADAGLDKTIDCATLSATLGSAAVSGNTYSWSPSSGLNDATLAMPTASPSATTTYTVTATAANGCTATDEVTVTVNGNLGSIGNYVWTDKNANGIQDEAATDGINGVTVELWKETSPGSGTYNFLSSTNTGNNAGNPGYYEFSICDLANYKIKFPITNGNAKLTTQTATAATDNNSDADMADGFSPAFSIDPNGSGVAKDNPTIDAGYFDLACLGNYVWNDLDKDGEQDLNEVGVAGVTVTLFNASNVVISTTITDAYGKYHFCELMPGDYKVSFTLPANYDFTNPDNVLNDALDSDADPISGQSGLYNLESGEDDITVDAGIYFSQPTTATVGNYVWFDTNQDGIQDPGENGISGVTVLLCDVNGNPVASTITDANGFYLFTDVNPGTYGVKFIQPVGLVFSPSNAGVSNPSNSDANPLTGKTNTFVVNSGDEITYVDAGLYYQSPLNGGLGDYVWFDTNQDGVQDANEAGVAGINVTLYGPDGTTVLATAETDVYGYYVFNNLPQGSYVVGFSNLPANYVFTNTLGSNPLTNSDANAGTGKTSVITLDEGEFDMTWDAGIYSTTAGLDNSIGNYVWYDINKNGVQDPNESGVGGVTVTLYDNSNTVIGVTATDNSGQYLFPNLPNGTYYVGFSNIPSNYGYSPTGAGTPSTDSDPNPSNGLTNTVTLTGNTHDMTLDAGISRGNGGKLGLGTLGDVVWYDMNSNGLQDPGEQGVPSVTVNLYECDGTTLLSTTTTNALGNYIFTGLSSGCYIIGFDDLPSGFGLTTKNADGQGLNGEVNSDVNSGTLQTDQIVLGPGEDKMSIDMGLVPPAGTASLGNFVWFDLDQNGIQDPGEPGVQGVSVTLYDNANNVVSTTTTDANGTYAFVGLTPGTYSVGFSNLPDGYEFTTFDANATGINGIANSDANVTTGLTAQVTLASGDNNINLDAGIVSTTVASVGDYVWLDDNRDGIQDANENGVGGILVTLLDNSNNPVASTITRPDGSYIFTNVIPGTYSITFTNLPGGYEFTSQESNPTSNTGSNADPLTGITPTFTVLAGTHNPTIDAGLLSPLTGGLGNYVWFDTDEDGIQDANEIGVPGVTATLYAADGTTVLATATTDGSGFYTFNNLADDDYIVGFSTLPSGYTATLQQGPVSDALNSDMLATGRTGIATVENGGYNPNVDGGIYLGTPLPVVFDKFETAVNGCAVYLHWTTLSEKNTSHFNVMRKNKSQVTFETIGRVIAAGESNQMNAYTFTDRTVSTGNYEYFLQIVDKDNAMSKSGNRDVTVICNANNGIEVYPNPTTDNLNILLNADETTMFTLSLKDMSGRTIMISHEEITGKKVVTLPMTHIAQGIYSLVVEDGLSTTTIKVRKED